MNPKKLLIKYSDKAALLLAVVFFLWSLYSAFLTGQPKVAEVKESIRNRLKTLEKNLRESRPDPRTPPDTSEILSQRYAHLPVVEPYRRYVLFKPMPVHAGLFQVLLGKESAISFPDVQLSSIVRFDKSILKVLPPEPIDYLNPYKGSRFKVMPLKATVNTPAPTTRIAMKDVDGLRYTFDVKVFEKPPEEKPLKPKAVEVAVLKGKVLLKMLWDNPQPLPRSAAETAGFLVYRKLSGRPDSMYQFLTEGEPAAPDAKRSMAITRELGIGEARPAPDRPAPEPAAGGEEGGAVTPDVVNETTDSRAELRDKLNSKDLEERLRQWTYFLDRTSVPGETYVYKIVAVTAPVDGKRKRSAPEITDPVVVPPDVQFWLSNVYGGNATIRVYKRDYDVDTWHSQSFTVSSGMPIGWQRQVRVPNPQGTRWERRPVNFDTGATLVAAFQDWPAYGVRRNLSFGATRSARPYSLKDETVNAIVILTKQGKLLTITPGRPPFRPRRLTSIQRRPLTRSNSGSTRRRPRECNSCTNRAEARTASCFTLTVTIWWPVSVAVALMTT